MMHIGLQELRVKWIRWYAVSVFIGIILGSCQVEPDVVFEKLDNSKDAGSDSETMMLDSGSNILNSELNDQDSLIPGLESWEDITNAILNEPTLVFWLLGQFQFKCPTENILPQEICEIPFAGSEDMPNETELNEIYSKYIEYPLELHDSIEECPFYEEATSVENDILLSNNPSERPPCSLLCDRVDRFIPNIQDIKDIQNPEVSNNEIADGFADFLAARNDFYHDPDKDKSGESITITACPLACEFLRCLRPMIDSLVERLIALQPLIATENNNAN